MKSFMTDSKSLIDCAIRFYYSFTFMEVEALIIKNSRKVSFSDFPGQPSPQFICSQNLLHE